MMPDTKKQLRGQWPANRRKRGLLPAGGQDGFTLADVAIATAIFAAIMVVCLGALISMSRVYFKSSVERKVQDIPRVVLGEIGRAIATTAVDVGAVIGPDANGWRAYCIAGIKYSFRLDPAGRGYQLDRNPPGGSSKKVNQVFVKSIVTDSMGNPTGNCDSVRGDPLATPPIAANPAPPPPGPGGNSIELLDYRMRLHDFSITNYNRLHVIRLAVIYGGDPDDDDLEKEIFEFDEELLTTAPDYLDFKLDDPVLANRALCELGEAFCYILDARREIYQPVTN